MELIESTIKKCDNCGNRAKYCICQKKKLSHTNINLCEECFKFLYECMGYHIVPKSPVAPYKNKRKEIEINESKN